MLFRSPADLAAAARTLAALQGRTHEVTTGVCLVHLRAHRERLLAVTTRVTFKALSPAQIARYHARMNPLDKAGAYAIQERGAEIIAGIEGSYTNVVGLPVEALLQALAEWAGMRR